MSKGTRRAFLRNSITTVAGLGMTSAYPATAWSRALGANDTIGVAVVGVRKRGKELVAELRNLPGVRVVAMCDVDTQFLDIEVKTFKDNNETVKTYVDFRKMMEDKDVDAVFLSVPDHLHGIMTIWACQAGKDVYCEKPLSHNIWEGRKMVEAAHKYQRIVGVGSQNRSDTGLLPFAEYLKTGALGKVTLARGISYNARLSIGKVAGPQPIPATCDYNLFQGPAPLVPLMRTQLHYDWHWCWPTGTGEMGNLGGHVLDDCRWTTGITTMPPRTISLGGRFGYDDDADTPNTLITYFDYEPFPVLYEIRALPKDKNQKMQTFQGVTTKGMDQYRGTRFGMVIHCEHGYFSGGRGGGRVFDNNDRELRHFPGDDGVKHVDNFLAAVRSRKTSALRVDVIEGHITASMVHMGDISYRLGQKKPLEEIKKTLEGHDVLAESFDRLSQHLKANDLDLVKNPLRIGPWLEFDAKQEQFVGDDSGDANMYLSRNYRAPFVVPEKV
jgi:predicted dehydrogenase